MPDLDLQILSDTTGMVVQKDNESLIQKFRFTKAKKNLIHITHIDSTTNLISLKKGDTMVLYKNEVYLFNEKHKLIFKKRNKLMGNVSNG